MSRLIVQIFLKFCSVGALAFIVDSLVFFFLLKLQEDIMIARILAFWCAATFTWLGNRLYTFKNQGISPKFKQWCRHMLSAHLSGGINLGVFWITLHYAPIYAAFVIGTSVGIASNYFFSQKYVFINLAKK